MKIFPAIVLSGCIALSTLVSCRAIVSVMNDDKVIAQVGKHRLTQSDVRPFIPEGTSPDDSVRIVMRYINVWASEQIFADEAEKRLSKEEKDVTEELEEYRMALLRYRYEQRYINERLDNLKLEIQKPEFLEGKGLSNEVNIRIFCYDAQDEMIVRHFTEQLIVDQSLDCHLIERNLYKVFLSICDDKRITEKAVQMEEKKGKEFLFHNLQKFANNKSFVEKMQYEPHEPGDVLLLTGVGEVFPFMRIHSLLEALQPEFPDIPILVMYPGTYDGRFVRLFDKLEPNPYYRAFNIIGIDGSNNHVL